MEEIKIPVILDIVSRELEVTSVLDNLGSRKRHLVDNRAMAMYYIRKFTNLSLAQIGEVFCKDHASVLHAMKIFSNQFETNRKFRFKAIQIRRRINEVYPLFDEPDPEQIKSPYEALEKSRAFNVSLINRHILHKEFITSIEQVLIQHPKIHKNYFNGIQLIYNTEQKNTRVGMVPKRQST